MSHMGAKKIVIGDQLWLNMNKQGGCPQKPFWIRLTDVQQGQNLLNS